MKIFAVMVTMLAVLPVFSVAQEAVVSAFVPDTQDSQDSQDPLELIDLDDIVMAKIVTGISRSSDCLASVTINRVDGEEKIVPAGGFLIEPGIHTLNGRAKLDTTYCVLGRDGNLAGFAPDLEVNFQASKTYYIGYDHKSENSDEWKLLVWKTELSPRQYPNKPLPQTQDQPTDSNGHDIEPAFSPPESDRPGR